MGFGSSSRALVEAPSYEIRMTQSPQRDRRGLLSYFTTVAACNAATSPYCDFLTVFYYEWRGRWEARLFISPNAALVMIYGRASTGGKTEEEKKRVEDYTRQAVTAQ